MNISLRILTLMRRTNKKMDNDNNKYIQEIRRMIAEKSKDELLIELDLLARAHMEVLVELKKRHQRDAENFAERSLK